MNDCKQLISHIPLVEISHCYREANNRCADVLARLGARHNRDFILYDSPPVDILKLISSDSVGQALS